MATNLFIRMLGTATVTAGLAIGLAATAVGQPVQSDPEDDFYQCLVDHPDTDGIGVCCVVYGGDYDEPGQACFIDFPVATSLESRSTMPRSPVPASHQLTVR